MITNPKPDKVMAFGAIHMGKTLMTFDHQYGLRMYLETRLLSTPDAVSLAEDLRGRLNT
jgi:hypothetical protein